MDVGPSAGISQGRALPGRQGAYSSSCDPEGLWARGVMRSVLHFKTLLAGVRGADRGKPKVPGGGDGGREPGGSGWGEEGLANVQSMH